MKLFPSFSAALFIATSTPAFAQLPVTLERSIPPPVTPQTGTEMGYSVAIDGGYTVCGAPAEDLGEDDGVVKVFDSATGALLHILRNPAGSSTNDRFGSSVAISGTRIVVGNCEAYESGGLFSSGAVFIFDLASPNPAADVQILTNPTPATGDYFGNSVAISGSKIIVGTKSDDEGAVNAGCAYVYDLDSGTPAVPVETLNNPAPAADDSFGWSVAISGNRVAVGAYLDDFGATDAGRVYVYDLDFVPVTLESPDFVLNKPAPSASDWFGIAVAIEGDNVVVGALLDDTSGLDSGIAYLFDLGSATPTAPVSALPNPEPMASDLFGYSVAISGNRVAVGAYQDDPASSTNAGSAYVYNISQLATPALIHTLNNPTPAVQDYFGVSVALAGDQLAVGAYLDDTGAIDAGSVYLYDLVAATPLIPTVVLNHPGSKSYGRFGVDVDVSGNLMVVGAPEDSAAGPIEGSVYVFDLDSQTPSIPILVLNSPNPSEDSNFGASVAINGTRIVVGVLHYNFGIGAKPGSAYVFDMTSPTPQVPIFTLYNPLPAPGDWFGSSVAIDGNWVAVGSPNKTVGGIGSAGITCVYDLSTGGNPLLPRHTIQSPNPVPDGFGFSLALSGDWLLVGEPFHDDGATNAGRVYIYELGHGPNPVLAHQLGNPSVADNDIFGYSVALSGSRILIGANYNAGATEVGRVYLFDILGVQPTQPILTFTNPTPAAYDRFGYSVAIAGDRVVIAAPFDDTDGENCGSVYLYDIPGAGLGVPIARISNPTQDNPTPYDPDWFGTSVAVDGTRVIVGAPESHSAAFRRGFSYVFGIGETNFQISTTIPACLVGPSASISGSIASGSVVINQIRYRIGTEPDVIVSNPGTTNPPFNIDLSALTDGAHTIVITATAADGTERSLSANFHRDQVGLSIARGVIMTWGCGVLQTSTNGVDWTDVPGATSPFAVPTGEPGVLWKVRPE